MTVPGVPDFSPVIERLIRIETKFDMVIATQADHEGRLRTLERAFWRLAGAAAVGGGVVGAVASLITAELIK